MPDENDKTAVQRVRPSEPEVQQPATPAELLKRKLEALADENETARSDRRAGELKQHIDVHLENVAASHAMYPVPPVPFTSLSEDERETWNKRRVDIDQANRAYHLAVQRSVVEHLEEDRHLAKLRVEAAAKTA